jgi:hypothetical protein
MNILDDFVKLSAAARQPDMPSLSTLRRMHARGELELAYVGRTPFLHIPTFRQRLLARESAKAA